LILNKFGIVLFIFLEKEFKMFFSNMMEVVHVLMDPQIPNRKVYDGLFNYFGNNPEKFIRFEKLFISFKKIENIKMEDFAVNPNEYVDALKDVADSIQECCVELKNSSSSSKFSENFSREKNQETDEYKRILFGNGGTSFMRSFRTNYLQETRIEDPEKIKNLVLSWIFDNSIPFEKFSKIKNLRELVIGNSFLMDLDGIEKFVNLKKIRISYSFVVKEISIISCPIIDLRYIVQGKELDVLTIQDCPLKSTDYISSAKSIKHLRLLNVPITNLKNVEKVHGLEILECHYTNIENVDNFIYSVNDTTLTKVMITNSRLRNVGGFRYHKNLNYTCYHGNRMLNLSKKLKYYF
jgi:hypothetical protein